MRTLIVLVVALLAGCDVALPEPCSSSCLEIPVMVDDDALDDLEVAQHVFGPAGIVFVEADDAPIRIETVTYVDWDARGRAWRYECEATIRLEHSRGELLLAHELGHALGLRHSRDRDSVMWHGPLRGAELGERDLHTLAAYAAHCWGDASVD